MSVSILISCDSDTIHLAIVNIETNEYIVGLQDSKYDIGSKPDINDEYLNDEHIHFEINKDSKVLESATINKKGVYKLNNNINIGDSKWTVMRKMGIPISDHIELKKGNRPIGEIDFLTYKNAGFLLGETKRVEMITIHNEKPAANTR